MNFLMNYSHILKIKFKTNGFLSKMVCSIDLNLRGTFYLHFTKSNGYL